MDYYKLLESTRLDDINDIKKKFRKKILECHPDKNLTNSNEKRSKELIEAWLFIKKNHGNPNVNLMDQRSDLIPLEFKQRGYDRIPTLGEFIRKEIERENAIKLKEKEILKLQDEKSDDGILDIIFNYLFN